MNPIQPFQPFHPLVSLRRLVAVTLAVTLTLLLLSISGPAVSLAGSPPALPNSPARLPEGLSAAEWAQITSQIQEGYYRAQPVAGGYQLTIDPIAQQAYLKASNTGMFDQFGWSVAVDGDTLVVGAHLEDSSATGVGGNQADNSASGAGAVYVFTRTGGVWSQQAYLKASNTGADDNFGHSVAVDGDTLVVGAPWEASSDTGVGGNQADNSATGAGAAYVFSRSGGVWNQQAYLKASNTGIIDFFGRSVAVDGDTLVVGAPFEDSSAPGVNGNQADDSAAEAGAAYVFSRTGGVWSQQTYLKASNTGEDDWFGWSVAVDGDTLVVGAPFEASSATGINGNQVDNSADNAGAAYTFLISLNRTFLPVVRK